MKILLDKGPYPLKVGVSWDPSNIFILEIPNKDQVLIAKADIPDLIQFLLKHQPKQEPEL